MPSPGGVVAKPPPPRLRPIKVFGLKMKKPAHRLWRGPGIPGRAPAFQHKGLIARSRGSSESSSATPGTPDPQSPLLSPYDPRALLESALHDSFPDDEGTPRRIKLVPPGQGLNERHFREHFKGPMPPDMQDLYALCSGFDLDYHEITFTEYHFQGYDCLFHDWIEVAADGFGNHWVLEIRPGAAAWGPVWFASHDPPVVLHVADDLTTFLRHFLDAYRGGEVHNPYACSHRDAMRIWEESHPWPTAAHVRAQLRATPDPLLAALTADLPDHAEIIDLRPNLRGFTWDRYDTHCPARRDIHPMLFALIPE
ncbi:MAG: SMI1/KNR4 family protein [Phycisphaerales bacterium]|nr:SMI1/KNR4 family protein [Phycisphaerales bacterium]